MKSKDKIPKDLDDAVKILKNGLQLDEIEYISNPKNEPASVHHFSGMALRNNWKLWHKSTRLVKWFKKIYKIDHADDISGIILDCLWRDVRGEPRKDKELAKSYIAHWKKYGK